jgi:hypothetical protein
LNGIGHKGHHIIKDEDGCEIRTALEEFLHGLVTAFVASIPVGKRLRGQFDPDLSQFLSKANNTKWFVRMELIVSDASNTPVIQSEQILPCQIPSLMRECRGPQPSDGGLGVSPKFSLSFFAAEGGEL